MAALGSGSGSKSLKEYLKRYESNSKEEDVKKKKKKKNVKAKPVPTGVLLMDEDPVWQKPVVIEENDHDSDEEERPQVDEDIEVKRMRRLEQIRAKRAHNAISEDGSGWVSLSPKRGNLGDLNSDLSPPRQRRRRQDTPPSDLDEGRVRDRQRVESKEDLSPPRRGRARNDTASPEPGKYGKEVEDLSPPRRGRARNDTPSPERDRKHVERNDDLSPPRRGRARNDTPSPERRKHGKVVADLSPPRRGRARNDTPSPERRKHGKVVADLSPPRRGRAQNDTHSPDNKRMRVKETVDMSPPRRGRSRKDTPSPEHRKFGKQIADLSPPRRGRVRNDALSSDHDGQWPGKGNVDLSPPRQRQKRQLSPSPQIENDISPPRRGRRESPHPYDLRISPGLDLSPPRKSRKDDFSSSRKTQKQESIPVIKEERKTGLITGREMKDEIDRTKKLDMKRFQEMDPSISGRNAEPIFRDKMKGERITKEEFLKSRQKVVEKPKEIKLEWGKGLAQKREAEARLQEMELEKDKPFARTRDDPDLDRSLKEAVRWGDPMAHLVKRKQSEPVLPNLGDNEKMKESGFIIPQDIPSHSWIKRGLEAAPNRYGIKPGRHWDGVDRSNGYEKESFKRKNEKQASEREAYLWSVSDM